jgi:hypothetical protein
MFFSFGPDDGPSDAEIRWRMLANLMILPVWTADAAIACFRLDLSREEALASLAAGLCPNEGPGIAERLLRDDGFGAARRRLIDTAQRADPDDPPRMRDLLRCLVLEAETAEVDAIGVYVLG